MPDHRSHRFLPLDARDPDFHRQVQLWADEAQLEIEETIVATRRTIASSQALMANVGRLLARR